MDREVPSYNFNKTQDFLLFYRMYFVVKCPSKDVCPPAPLLPASLNIGKQFEFEFETIFLNSKAI